MPLRLRIGKVLWKFMRWILFYMDPERAHKCTIEILVLVAKLRLCWLLRFLYESPYAEQLVRIGSITAPSPFGIGPGFDKDGRAVAALDALGLGFICIGTVLPEPQDGNTGTRLWRVFMSWRDYDLVKIFWATVNRYGFPSKGALWVAHRLSQTFKRHTIRARIIVSVGANKKTVDTRPEDPDYLQRVVDDHLAVVGMILPVLRRGDAIQLNISSPNTPGLIALFRRLPEFLRLFTDGVQQITTKLVVPMPPLILKIPPDDLDAAAQRSLNPPPIHPEPATIDKLPYQCITDDQLLLIITNAVKCGFTAIEATNTTTDIKARFIREVITGKGQQTIRKPVIIPFEYVGGIAGDPLYILAKSIIKRAVTIIKKHAFDLAVIGEGGIRSGRHAGEFLDAGANAVLAYSGLVLEGPPLIHEVLSSLETRSRKTLEKEAA